MAVGNPLPSPLFALSVSDTQGGTYDVVSLLNSWDATYNENIAEFDVFQLVDPIEVNGRAKIQMSFSGFMADSTDAGQARITAHELAKDYVFVKVLWDGTNGFTCKARVATKKGTGKAGASLIEIAYTFMVLPSSVLIVGLGPIL